MSLLLGLSGVISKFEAKNINMRITQIDLQNIGVFKNLSLSFPEKKEKDKAEIHIFTGENGSGKSTLLKAFASAFEGVQKTEEGLLALVNNTNQFYRYLHKGKRNVGGKLTLLEDNKKTEINFFPCPDGANHLHTEKIEENKWLNSYRLALVHNDKPNDSYPCAFFAYSGDRGLTWGDEINEKSPFVNTKNPLHQSLDFVKQPTLHYNINNWLYDSLLKRGYAQNNHLDSKANLYDKTIRSLEELISQIVDNEVKFVLDDDLRDAQIEFVKEKKKVDLHVIPDGLKSIISWTSDLCMRLEKLKWQDDTPIFERNIILFLDEIEIHLHPAWQRKVLPIVQKLFPNAQIFLSTHSPFVVNSVDGAYIYELKYENGETTIAAPTISSTFKSIDYVLENVFDVKEERGEEAENELASFYEMRDKVLKKQTIDKKKFLKTAKHLIAQDLEIQIKVQYELRQLNRIIGKEEFVI